MGTRKRRSSKKPTTPEAPRTSETAENTLSKMEGKEDAPEIKVETPEPNKYAPKPKVGAPTLGRSPNYVSSVGLGKLRVETAHGNIDV